MKRIAVYVGGKAKMMNIEAVRKWLRTYESLSSGRLGVDFLPKRHRPIR